MTTIGLPKKKLTLGDKISILKGEFQQNSKKLRNPNHLMDELKKEMRE